MAITWIMLCGGGVLLSSGAELTVKGAASLARRTGISPLVVGLTIVAFGTSAPELAVSVLGAIQGNSGIALGNVIGSNLFNIGVVLGLAALIRPLQIGLPLIRFDVPFLIVLCLGMPALFACGTVSRPAGLLLLLLLILYTVRCIRTARRQETREIDREFDAGVPLSTRSPWADMLLIAAGIALLVTGSKLLVDAAVTIARALGIGETWIGLTIVAAGTSLPELATSAAAAIRRQPDLSVGNVVGSNIFNLLGVLGLSAAARPLDTGGITSFDLWMMAGSSLLLWPLLWTGRTLKRREGALLLVVYAVYLILRGSAG